MALLGSQISQTMKVATAASLQAGEVNNVTFLGGNGNDTFVVNGNYNNIATESGDDNVMLTGDFNMVLDDCGNNAVYSVGNNNTIATMNGNNVIYSQGNLNEIITNNGNQYIESHGHGNLIDAGNGSHMIFFTGDSNDVKFGDGNSTVHFFGDQNVIEGGNGNHSVKTLDWLIEQGQYTEYADLVESYARVSEKTDLVQSIKVEQDVTATTNQDLGTGSAALNKESGSQTIKEVPSKAELLSMLSSGEKAAAEKLDLTEQYNGGPRYIFAYGSGDKKVHVYDTAAGKTPKSIVQLPQGNNYLYGKGEAVQTNDEGIATYITSKQTANINKVSSGKYSDIANCGETVGYTYSTRGSIDTYETTTQYDFGHMNNAIYLGNGTQEVYYTGSGAVFAKDQNGCATQPSTYVTRGGIETKIRSTYDNRTYDIKYFLDNSTYSQKITGASSTKVTTGSPLIVDFNQDGKVSAEAGKGVDIDNNGKADGAATGGDKMLAMSDSNKNGKIDGSEVFGDQTVDPFTGQKINAANGFEALKVVAESAYKATGINCMDKGNVDLQALKVALSLIGINLGFISDNNVNNLEDLAHVKSINVANYKTQQESGDVQHNQLGSYTSTDGTQHKADDVWFKYQ